PTVAALAEHIRAQLEPESAQTPLGVLAEIERLDKALDRLAMDEVAMTRLRAALVELLRKTGVHNMDGMSKHIDKIDLASADDFYNLGR
ncbi:MAG: hypothetical protein AAF449_19300, partial [Myxococcota bacterium]